MTDEELIALADDSALVERMARAMTKTFLEMTGDYAEVPEGEVWTRPRYEPLKFWFCRASDEFIRALVAERGK